jgi:cell division protein FtsI/penicillin-binding protein 2
VRSPVHLGWFASYNDVSDRKLVVVVLLTGGSRVKGAVAAEVAGAVFRNLESENYFGPPQLPVPLALMSLQSK